MVMNAKMLSEKIRMKRKQMHEKDETVDTSPGPKMNPQDVWNAEKEAQLREIPGARDRTQELESPVMQEEQKDDSQDPAVLRKHMARIAAILSRLSMSR